MHGREHATGRTRTTLAMSGWGTFLAMAGGIVMVFLLRDMSEVLSRHLRMFVRVFIGE